MFSQNWRSRNPLQVFHFFTNYLLATALEFSTPTLEVYLEFYYPFAVEFFCKNSEQLETGYQFCKKAPSQMFHRVFITPLTICLKTIPPRIQIIKNRNWEKRVLLFIQFFINYNQVISFSQPYTFCLCTFQQLKYY